VVYALLFFVAFCFYDVLWPSAPLIEPDSGKYLRAAQDLSDFHIDELQERAPGYPLLLLLSGSSPSPKRILFFVSLLLHFASIWLLASVLYRAGLREVILTLFGLILLLPPYVEPAAYVLSDNLAEAMLVAGFVSFVFWILYKRTMWICISALTIGYAALTRPTYQLLAFAIAGYFFLANFLFCWTQLNWKDVIRGSLILVCGFMIIVGGYAFFNYRSFGYFGVTPKLGLTLSTKTVRFVERLPDNYAVIRAALIGARTAELADGDHTGTMYIWKVVPELSEITNLRGPELSAYMLRLNLLLIQEAPLTYLQEVVWAFGSYWFPSSAKLANLNSRKLQFFWAVVHFCLIGGFTFNLVLLLGTGIYLKTCMRLSNMSNRLPVSELRLIYLQACMLGLAGTIVFYTGAVSSLTETGDPRYRVCTDGLIVFMIFLGTHLWWRLVDVSRTVFSHTQEMSSRDNSQEKDATKGYISAPSTKFRC